MRAKNILIILSAMIMTSGFICGIAQADLLKIVVTQDQQGVENSNAPLVSYLNTKGLHVEFIPAKDYPSAALMLAEAKVDAIFSSSGIAGIMIIKKIAFPVVRPLATDGTSTYWAVTLAPKGSDRFMGDANYFRGKKVALCSLASAGEIYFYSIGGDAINSKIIKTPSHGTAIHALANGKVDVAIVKNRVWNSMKTEYPNLEIVNVDSGENPNGTLLISKIANPDLATKVTAALLALTEDSSVQGRKVKSKMDILGYIKTTENDFEHTLNLLTKAGVTPAFNFEF